MKRVFLPIVLSMSAIAAVAVIWLALAHNSVSGLAADARAALLKGEKERAKELFIETFRKDDANEDACICLGDLFSEENNLEVAAFFYERAMNLNPLNAALEEKFFDTLSTAGMDAYAIFKFENFPKGRRASANTIFRVGKSYIRTNQAYKAEKLLEDLQMSDNVLSALLSGELAVFRNDFDSAKKNFLSTIQNAKKQDVKNAGRIGLSLTYAHEKKYPEAEGELKFLKSPSRDIEADCADIMATVAISKKDIKTALEQKRIVLGIRTSDINALLECAELAESIRDGTTLSELRNGILPKSKTSVLIDYYIRALEESTKKNYSNVEKFLEYSGDLKNRDAAKIVGFKAACRTGNSARAIELASPFIGDKINARTKYAVLSQLLPLLKKESGKNSAEGRRLSEIVGILAGKDIRALEILSQTEMSSGNYEHAISLCKKIRSINPENETADRCELASLYGLGLYSEVLQKTESKVKQFPHNAFYAAFHAKAAAANGDVKTALEKYIEAVSLPDSSPEFCSEARNYVFEMGSDSQIEKIVDALLSKNTDFGTLLGEISAASFSLKKGDIKNALSTLENCARKFPKEESAILALSGVQYLASEKGAALKTLEKFITQNPSSKLSRIRTASLLIEDGSKDSAQKALSLISESGDAADTAAALLVKAKAFIILGKEVEAISASKDALALAPNDTDAARILSNLLFKRGQYEDAFRTIINNDILLRNDSSFQKLKKSLLETVNQSPSKAYKKTLLKEFLNKFPTDTDAKKILLELDADNENP